MRIAMHEDFVIELIEHGKIIHEVDLQDFSLRGHYSSSWTKGPQYICFTPKHLPNSS